jgi:hypothetical protein
MSGIDSAGPEPFTGEPVAFADTAGGFAGTEPDPGVTAEAVVGSATPTNNIDSKPTVATTETVARRARALYPLITFPPSRRTPPPDLKRSE